MVDFFYVSFFDAKYDWLVKDPGRSVGDHFVGTVNLTPKIRSHLIVIVLFDSRYSFLTASHICLLLVDTNFAFKNAFVMPSVDEAISIWNSEI